MAGKKAINLLSKLVTYLQGDKSMLAINMDDVMNVLYSRPPEFTMWQRAKVWLAVFRYSR